MMGTRIVVAGMALSWALVGPGCWGSPLGGPGHDGGDGGLVGDAATHGDGLAGQQDGPAGQQDGPAGDDSGITGGRIEIYVAGDATPRTFTDGLSGQTPRDFKIALSKYYAMTSAVDPGALCFDHGDAEVVADLSGDTLVGTCATASLPTGSYTHGRVRVEWAEYTVSGVLHHLGQSYSGDFTFFRAYSDVVRNGVPMSAGQGVIRFSVTGTEIPVTYPAALAAAPGISVVTTNGECWMTFTYSHPLPVDQANPDTHWARFTWQIFEGFRWSELSLAGYDTGHWDVSTVVGGTENVAVPGATGYYTTSCED